MAREVLVETSLAPKEPEAVEMVVAAFILLAKDMGVEVSAMMLPSWSK